MQKHKVNLRRFHAMVLDLAKTIKEDYVQVQISLGGNSEKYAYLCYINKVGWTTAYPEINDPRVCLAEMKARIKAFRLGEPYGIQPPPMTPEELEELPF